jgi:nucleotide-binding universal stress UspA family protein
LRDNGTKQNQEVTAMSIFPTRILLATDGSENVAPATDVAVQLSKVTDSELHITYVGEDAYSATLIYPEITDPGGVEREDQVLLEQLQRQFEQMSRRVLETEVEKVREAGGTVAQTHLRMGKAAAEIVELAEELGARLVVVGSRGLGGIRRALMGSVSDSVVRHAHCPVLVVRREEE